MSIVMSTCRSNVSASGIPSAHWAYPAIWPNSFHLQAAGTSMMCTWARISTSPYTPWPSTRNAAPFLPRFGKSPSTNHCRQGRSSNRYGSPGVHSNVGGSYPDDRLSDIALDWMIKRRRHTPLEITGLGLNPANLPVEKCVQGKGIESRTTLYMTSYPYPYLRTLCNVLTPPIGKIDGLIRNMFKPENSRRNLPDTNEETVNEYLHISALRRWHLPQVPHDLAEDKDSPLQPYRPPNLAALIKERKEKNIEVAGWDGEVMAAEEIPWPE